MSSGEVVAGIGFEVGVEPTKPGIQMYESWLSDAGKELVVSKISCLM